MKRGGLGVIRDDEIVTVGWTLVSLSDAPSRIQHQQQQQPASDVF